MRARSVSNEGWAAIYELIFSGIPRKAIAVEFGISYDYQRKTIKRLEREGMR